MDLEIHEYIQSWIFNSAKYYYSWGLTVFYQFYANCKRKEKGTISSLNPR